MNLYTDYKKFVFRREPFNVSSFSLLFYEDVIGWTANEKRRLRQNVEQYITVPDFRKTRWLFPLMNIVLFADMIPHSDRFIRENCVKPVTR